MTAIFVVFTFAFFVLLDVIVRKVRPRWVEAVQVAQTRGELPGPQFALARVGVENFELPKGLFFHKGHTWANLEASGRMKVGVDDFAQKILGRFDRFKVRKVGERVKQGEKIFSVQQGKHSLSFTSPVDGIISSVNEEVIDDPQVVKENPYEAGWIYTVKPADLARNIRQLTIAEDATAWLRNEVRNFRDFIAEQFVQDKLVGQTLQDGGLPVEGLMEHMDEFTWMRFQEEFLI
ncbi:MAG: glycine cleavage system protein H [bacterium]